MWMIVGGILLAALVLGGVRAVVLYRQVKKEDRKRHEEEERREFEGARKRQEFLACEKQELEEWAQCERRVEAMHPEYVDPPWPPLTNEEFNERMERMEAKRKAVATMMVEFQHQKIRDH